MKILRVDKYCSSLGSRDILDGVWIVGGDWVDVVGKRNGFILVILGMEVFWIEIR